MSSPRRCPPLDLIQFRDPGRHPLLFGWAPLTTLQYMFTGGYQKPFMCALVSLGLLAGVDGMAG